MIPVQMRAHAQHPVLRVLSESGRQKQKQEEQMAYVFVYVDT